MCALEVRPTSSSRSGFARLYQPRLTTKRSSMTEHGKPTKISFVYSNPADPGAFETAYSDQIALARKLPGLIRLQTSKVWPKEDGSPTPAYRMLDLYFADYAAASEHATGGVAIAFAEVLDDA